MQWPKTTTGVTFVCVCTDANNLFTISISLVKDKKISPYDSDVKTRDQPTGGSISRV
jgi:hypothetical protein